MSDSAVVCPRRDVDRDETPKKTFSDLSRRVDILKELYKRSMIGTVCVNILNRLSKKDLLRYDESCLFCLELLLYHSATAIIIPCLPTSNPILSCIRRLTIFPYCFIGIGALREVHPQDFRIEGQDNFFLILGEDFLIFLTLLDFGS